jgi:hypothetical protein
MNPSAIPQTVVPPVTQEPNLSRESPAQAPEIILAPASTTTGTPRESHKDTDTGYYNQHWGINE